MSIKEIIDEWKYSAMNRQSWREYMQKFLPILLGAVIILAVVLAVLLTKDRIVGNVYGAEVCWNYCSPEDLQPKCREKIVDLVKYIEANKPDDVDFTIISTLTPRFCVEEKHQEGLAIDILFTEERTSIPIGIRTGNERSHIKQFTSSYRKKLYEWVGKEAKKRGLIWDLKHIECKGVSGVVEGAEIDTTKAVIHHTATPSNTTIESIRRYHIKEKGWDDIGYHFIIKQDGSVVEGRSMFKQGAHAKGRNDYVGIALIGMSDFPEIQIAKLVDLLQRLNITHIERHHEFCPSDGVPVEKIKGYLIGRLEFMKKKSVLFLS